MTEAQFAQFTTHLAVDAVLWSAPDGKLVYANPAACRLLKFSRKELLSRRFFDIAKDLGVSSWRAWWKRIRRDKHAAQESYYRTKEGKHVPVFIQSHYVKHEDGEYHCAIARDTASEHNGREALDKAKAALRDLMTEMETVRSELSEKIAANLRHLVIPVLRKLKEGDTAARQKQLALIEKNLLEITHSFGIRLEKEFHGLSRREIEICDMVRHGFSIKEIADHLHISDRTVETHRYNIRRKLGLSSKSLSLASFLHSFREQTDKNLGVSGKGKK